MARARQLCCVSGFLIVAGRASIVVPRGMKRRGAAFEASRSATNTRESGAAGSGDAVGCAAGGVVSGGVVSGGVVSGGAAGGGAVGGGAAGGGAGGAAGGGAAGGGVAGGSGPTAATAADPAAPSAAAAAAGPRAAPVASAGLAAGGAGETDADAAKRRQARYDSKKDGFRMFSVLQPDPSTLTMSSWVQGSSCNLYQVVLAAVPTCTCKDYEFSSRKARKRAPYVCVHIQFVADTLFDTTKFPRPVDGWYDEDGMRTLLGTWNSPDRAKCVDLCVVRAARMVHESIKDGSLPAGTDFECPICFGALTDEGGDPIPIVRCTTCEKWACAQCIARWLYATVAEARSDGLAWPNVDEGMHTWPFSTWVEYSARSSLPLLCWVCKRETLEDPDLLAAGMVAGRRFYAGCASDDGYVNTAIVAGEAVPRRVRVRPCKPAATPGQCWAQSYPDLRDCRLRALPGADFCGRHKLWKRS